jgi:folate-binding Fe-S cluster repair protein YgfZ
MLSMDYLGGLSFDKGCYTGQEIVTRTQFLGKVKRTLHRLATDDSLELEVGAPLNCASTGESVGELFCWARLPGGGTSGLAIIRNEVVAETTLEIAGHRIEAVSVAI